MSVTKSRITVLGVVCDEESHGDLRFSSFGRRYAVLKQVLAASALTLYALEPIWEGDLPLPFLVLSMTD